MKMRQWVGRSARLGLAVVLSLTTSVVVTSAEEAGPEKLLAVQARDLLKRYCYECHGTKQEAPDFNVALYRTVIGAENKYIVPRNLEESAAWVALDVAKRMPPEGSPQPTAEERAVIQKWIEGGAPEWPVAIEARPFVSDIDQLTAIRDDLRAAEPNSRRFFRYFSMANLHNNWSVDRVGKSVPVEQDVLNLARAALSKACNSLSWESQLAIPKPVDAQATVLRIDLRELGWHRNNQWKELLRQYPYGLSQQNHRDPAVQQLASEVEELSGTALPCVRLDWFIDTATRPKLYAAILELPLTIGELEKKLQVDVNQDFLQDRLARAGFAESGVSRSNRLVDRHPAAFGYYWKSYDFAKSEGQGNLFRFPLGPKFDGNPFAQQTFDHDGGEMIFSLPNGLQGYYLSTAKGDRIDEGPIEIVRDPQEFSGTPKVANGLSCMGCHTAGMKRFTDTIRNGLALEGEARNKVDRLFPDKDRMRGLVQQDEEKFLAAAARATAPFLNPKEPASVTPDMLRNYPEPVGTISRMYQRDLSLEEAAFELGLQDAKELKERILANPALRQLGLAPLANGAAIKREAWSSMQGLSVFHRAALQTDRGTPVREF